MRPPDAESTSGALSWRPVGRVGRSHGLHGAFRVTLHGPEHEEALRNAKRVRIEGLGESPVDTVHEHGREWLLKAARVRRIEVARSLLHAEILVPVESGGDDGPRPAGADVSGLPLLLDGAPVGEALGYVRNAPAPLLRVRAYGREQLLPAGAPYLRIDAEAVRLEDPPAGLLEGAPEADP